MKTFELSSTEQQSLLLICLFLTLIFSLLVLINVIGDQRGGRKSPDNHGDHWYCG